MITEISVTNCEWLIQILWLWHWNGIFPTFKFNYSPLPYPCFIHNSLIIHRHRSKQVLGNELINQTGKLSLIRCQKRKKMKKFWQFSLLQHPHLPFCQWQVRSMKMSKYCSKIERSLENHRWPLSCDRDIDGSDDNDLKKKKRNINWQWSDDNS